MKEIKGTKTHNRRDILEELRRDVGSVDHVNSIVSFALNLLPYYTPNKALNEWTYSVLNTKEYCEHIRDDRVLTAMAYYLQSLDPVFIIKKELESTLHQMADWFKEKADPMGVRGNAGVEKILQDIRAYNNDIKAISEEVAKVLEPILLIEYAKRLDENFKVFYRT